MEEMRDLDKLLKRLETATDKRTIIEVVQKIGAKILTHYEIRLGNLTIEPLRVEAYLYKPVYFEDKFIHKEKGKENIVYGPQQRDRIGELYIHSGYSGADIVLSRCKTYAFSFLLKNSRILRNDEIIYPSVKQIQLGRILKEQGIPIDYHEKVLYRKAKPNETIVFKTVRNGLSKIAERPDFRKAEQNEFNTLLISLFIELKEHTSSEFDFEAGFGGDRAVVEYLKDYKAMHPEVGIDELDRIRKELYPNGSKSEFKKEFEK